MIKRIKKLAAVAVMLSLLLIAAPSTVSKEIAIIPLHHHFNCATKPTQAQLDEQIKVLNKAFADTPFRFVNRSVDYVPKPYGNPKELDIYGVHIVQIFGLGYLEVVGMFNGTIIVIDCEVLPGGGWPDFDDGSVAVHEVGHWLGLDDEEGTCNEKRYCNWMEGEGTFKGGGYFSKEQVDKMIKKAKERGIVFLPGLTT